MQNLCTDDPSQNALRISAAGFTLWPSSESRPLNASTFAKQGNQGRAQEPRRILLAGNVPNGVRYWKNLLRRYYRVRRLPDNSCYVLLCSLPSSFSGAGEGIRTPDPLITNQMLYRLSYASNWGKARLRANSSHGSLPDVRDNYIKYHRAKMRRNNTTARTQPQNVIIKP